MHEFELIIALLAGVIGLAALADRISVPYPMALLVGGMVFGALPFTPNVIIDPDLVLMLLLAPAVYSSAATLDWRSFRQQTRPILSLAIRLVITTTIGIGVVAGLVVSGMDWGPAFVLGAVVSPPDAVATLSIVRRLGLPNQLITILEGESLVNDATAIVLYRLAVGAVATGSFSLVGAAGQFLWVASGGIAIGLGVGLAASWFATRVVTSSAIGVAISLLIPFLAYLLAESVGVSGVLAVVLTGLVTARETIRAISGERRIQSAELWGVVNFLTEGFAFVLIGLQLPAVLSGLGAYSTGQLVWYAIVIVAITAVLRVVWVFWEIGGDVIAPTADAVLPAAAEIGTGRASLLRGVLRLVFRRGDVPHHQRPSLRGVAVISWAGMRGIVTLTTALAIPFAMDDGSPFPERDLIIFLAFCVILFTILVQGATLPLLIRRLNFPPDDSDKESMHLALSAMYDAGNQRLDQLARQDWVTSGLQRRARTALEHARGRGEKFIETPTDDRDDFAKLMTDIEEAQRRAARELEARGDISEQTRRQLERRLDLHQVSRS